MRNCETIECRLDATHQVRVRLEISEIGVTIKYAYLCESCTDNAVHLAPALGLLLVVVEAREDGWPEEST